MASETPTKPPIDIDQLIEDWGQYLETMKQRQTVALNKAKDRARAGDPDALEYALDSVDDWQRDLLKYVGATFIHLGAYAAYLGEIRDALVEYERGLKND